MSFLSVYSHHLAKVQKKGKTQNELNRVMRWLTGYTLEALLKKIASNDSFESFFNNAPELNPKYKLIKGAIYGVRVAEIDQPLMQEVRYLDKLVDELAKGKKCRLSSGTNDRSHTTLSRTPMVKLHMKNLPKDALQKK